MKNGVSPAVVAVVVIIVVVVVGAIGYKLFLAKPAANTEVLNQSRMSSSQSGPNTTAAQMEGMHQRR